MDSGKDTNMDALSKILFDQVKDSLEDNKELMEEIKDTKRGPMSKDTQNALEAVVEMATNITMASVDLGIVPIEDMSVHMMSISFGLSIGLKLAVIYPEFAAVLYDVIENHTNGMGVDSFEKTLVKHNLEHFI